MDFLIKLNRQPCALQFQIATTGTQPIRIIVLDPTKENTVYANGKVDINQNGSFFVRLPRAPQQALVRIFNQKVGPKAQDGSFRYQWKQLPLKTKDSAYNRFDKSMMDLIHFGEEWAENAGVLSAGARSVYFDDSGRYQIHYVDYIVNGDGKVLSTPARISTVTKRIECAKTAMAKFTVPARFAFITHEIGHGFLNKDPKNEVEADLQGLRVYLGRGWSRKEAYHAYGIIFAQNESPTNEKRWPIVEKFILNWEKENGPNYGYYYKGECGER